MNVLAFGLVVVGCGGDKKETVASFVKGDWSCDYASGDEASSGVLADIEASVTVDDDGAGGEISLTISGTRDGESFDDLTTFGEWSIRNDTLQAQVPEFGEYRYHDVEMGTEQISVEQVDVTEDLRPIDVSRDGDAVVLTWDGYNGERPELSCQKG